jgi:hypothetical protein
MAFVSRRRRVCDGCVDEHVPAGWKVSDRGVFWACSSRRAKDEVDQALAEEEQRGGTGDEGESDDRDGRGGQHPGHLALAGSGDEDDPECGELLVAMNETTPLVLMTGPGGGVGSAANTVVASTVVAPA